MKDNVMQILILILSAVSWLPAVNEYLVKGKMYILIFSPFFLIAIGFFGGMEYLAASLLLVNLIFLIIVIIKEIRHKSKMVFPFLISLGLIFALTILFRDGRGNAPVYIVPFWSFMESFRTGDFARLGHFINNILLFTPFGFFAYGISGKTKNVFCSGVLLTCTIELSQLMFQLGETDIDDIIANSFGTLLGILFFRLFFGEILKLHTD